MRTSTKVIGGALAVVALAVGFWLARPLFVDDVVDEDFPAAVGAVVPDGMTAEEVESEMETAASGPDVEMVEDMPDGEPVAVVDGTFFGASRYDAGGTATIYRLADGSHVLRFEDFMVTNGPDLRVYLAPLNDGGAPDLGLPGAMDIGRLSGNVGNQNYDIPAEFDLDQPLGVVIYCEPFSVTFATAPLS